jgi:hypothetical protein
VYILYSLYNLRSTWLYACFTVKENKWGQVIHKCMLYVISHSLMFYMTGNSRIITGINISSFYTVLPKDRVVELLLVGGCVCACCVFFVVVVVVLLLLGVCYMTFTVIFIVRQYDTAKTILICISLMHY